MTPAARLSAAIEVLDRVLAGQPVEQVLTNWGRANRFAGSGDRAALRDLVYDALRCKRSFAALGGAADGRGLILGGIRAKGLDPAALFTGEGHAPSPVLPAETGHEPQGFEALDCPDWLASRLQASLGEDFAPVLAALRQRAPVFLRVNLLKADLALAAAALRLDGIATRVTDHSKTALEVTENARKIHTSRAYLDGLVELQDLSSQALVEALPLRPGLKVLDYCAGGGGKTLAMAARAPMTLFAHDAAPTRMRDLPERARRAGAKLHLTETPANTESYDLILTDVPCSGSGSWRRDPQGKWALAEARLAELVTTQAAILDTVLPMLAPKGVLAYATCSLLADENEAQIAGFLARHPGWQAPLQRRFSPLDGGDGFYLALLTRD